MQRFYGEHVAVALRSWQFLCRWWEPTVGWRRDRVRARAGRFVSGTVDMTREAKRAGGNEVPLLFIRGLKFFCRFLRGTDHSLAVSGVRANRRAQAGGREMAGQALFHRPAAQRDFTQSSPAAVAQQDTVPENNG